MKHNILIASTLAVLLTACGFHTQENKEITPAKSNANPPAAPRPQAAQVNVGDAKIPADLIAAVEAGNISLGKLDNLKPGAVIFAGVIATKTDDDMTVDEHLPLAVNHEGDSYRSMDDAELKVIDQATNRKTYINIGCKDSQINAQQIAGLQKGLLQMHGTFMHGHADKIFLCASDAMTMKNTVLYANEIVMNNASFVISHSSTGLVNICARTLTLIGQNRITSVEKKIDGSLGPGSPIFLSVLEDVQGSGSLLINQ
jgi:hypothetical protein